MKVKLCGVADLASLIAVGAARPDAVGFVLAPSVRRVPLDALPALLDRVPRNVQRWAVFREPDPEIVAALNGLPLTGVQGHAGWDGRGLPEAFAFLPVWLDGPDLLDRLSDSGWAGGPRDVDGLIGAVLLDGPAGGGAGVRADPVRARAAAGMVPLVLAGGLTPSTVADAVADVRPYGVDVSSGIESAPGVKDPALARAFVDAARAASVG